MTLVAISEDLLKRAESNEIEVRISGALVAEGAPLTTESLPYALERFRRMSQLSKGHCLIPPDDLIRGEARVLFGLDPQMSAVVREGGNWLPQSILEELTFPNREELVTRGLSQEALTRRQRRAAMRALFNQHGRLTPEGEWQFAKALGPMLEQVREHYPVSAVAENLLAEYMKGRVSGVHAFSEILLSLSDLEIFGKWLALHWEEVHPITRWIRSLGKSLADSFSPITGRTDALWQAAWAAGLSDREILNMRNEAAAKSSQLCVSLARKSLDPAPFGEPVGDPWQLAPGTAVMAACLSEIVKRATLAPGQSRPLKPSDAGDIVHSVYVPYVDSFRADGFMASVLCAAAPMYRERIVSDIRELPAQIDAVLQRVD